MEENEEGRMETRRHRGGFTGEGEEEKTKGEKKERKEKRRARGTDKGGEDRRTKKKEGENDGRWKKKVDGKW